MEFAFSPHSATVRKPEANTIILEQRPSMLGLVERIVGYTVGTAILAASLLLGLWGFQYLADNHRNLLTSYMPFLFVGWITLTLIVRWIVRYAFQSISDSAILINEEGTYLWSRRKIFTTRSLNVATR